MALADSSFSSVHLRKKPERFLTLLGVTVPQFDAIFEKLYAVELAYQKRRHSLWREARVEKRVEGNKAILREHLCITLLYLRQYNIQEVLATAFNITQSQVSRIITRITHLLEQVLPVPDKTVEILLQQIQQMDPEIRQQYSATLIVDASEQRIERSQDKQKQRSEYSGKKNVIPEKSK